MWSYLFLTSLLLFYMYLLRRNIWNDNIKKNSYVIGENLTNISHYNTKNDNFVSGDNITTFMYQDNAALPVLVIQLQVIPREE